MECLNIDRSDRKFVRKLKKAQHVVEKQTGIQCTMHVTKNLAICNAGLVNGLTEESVHEHFSKYGALDKIVMLPGKSCAFVSYKTVECAQNTYEKINGKLNLGQNNNPLYLSFVETLPVEFQQRNNEENPPGLIVLNDFVSEDEENLLLALVNSKEDSVNSGSLKHRKVKHYGYEFRYDINNVDKNSPLEEEIPKECNFLWARLQSHSVFNYPYWSPDQLTVNCYKAGQGIPPHVDTHSAFEDVLLSLSLGSAIVMDFHHKDGRHVPVFLPQRSLLIMSGESRYDWTHGIIPRKMDIIPTENGLTVIQRNTRVSFTFRKVLKGECECNFKTNCDSHLKNETAKNFEDNIAANLEKTHVLDVYENIADHFSETRHKPWPNVLAFVESLESGSILVDVGCGNGKYLGINQNIFEIGCDSSSSLINLCAKRAIQVFVCNCLSIPLREESADGIISIAVIHHLANVERRFQAIKEIVRVLRVNGKSLIYVWAKDQCKNQQKSTYLKQDRKNRKSNNDAVNENKAENVVIANDISLPLHTNRTQFQYQDMLVPWKLKNNTEDVKTDHQTYLRYYHVFEEGELEALCRRLDNVEVIKSYYDQGNWCVMLQKISG